MSDPARCRAVSQLRLSLYAAHPTDCRAAAAINRGSNARSVGNQVSGTGLLAVALAALLRFQCANF